MPWDQQAGSTSGGLRAATSLTAGSPRSVWGLITPHPPPPSDLGHEHGDKAVSLWG